jgi:hypothetical protein
MDLLFQLLQPRSSRSFFATACFGTATARCRALPHSLGTTPRRSFPRLNLHNDRVRRNHGRLPSSRCIESARTHHARVCALPLRASDTTLRLPITNPPKFPITPFLANFRVARATCNCGRVRREHFGKWPPGCQESCGSRSTAGKKTMFLLPKSR